MIPTVERVGRTSYKVMSRVRLCQGLLPFGCQNAKKEDRCSEKGGESKGTREAEPSQPGPGGLGKASLQRQHGEMSPWLTFSI